MLEIRKLLKELRFLPSKLRNYIVFRIKYVDIGNKVKVRGSIKIIGRGKITIKDGTVINSSPYANPVGGKQQTVFYVINNASLIIGENSGLSNSTICCSNSIIIGDNVKIGGGCEIYDTDFHSLDYLKRRKTLDDSIKSSPIKIGNDVFIGANSLILKGVEIGDCSIIGAGSVITKSVPKNEIWAGNPARFIRKIN